ncbi:hypothetical protein KSB_50930 [Ktedonobacter robiniae]|uniref:Uncharacterized protein n=1 Tax=Ktedonobacter robiniae TaxID=2778365 RepID=A0ABQ3UVA4_9CHLR|nr:hypothetical protein KSB_50930 [Ktedonobacter robiniae]
MTLPEAYAGGFSAHAELCAGCPPKLLRPWRRYLTYRGRQRPGSLTETQDMELRQLASRGLVALQCGQQSILRGPAPLPADMSRLRGIPLNTGVHGN